MLNIKYSMLNVFSIIGIWILIVWSFIDGGFYINFGQMKFDPKISKNIYL